MIQFIYLAALIAGDSSTIANEASVSAIQSESAQASPDQGPNDPDIEAFEQNYVIYQSSMHAKKFDEALAAAQRLDPGRDNPVGDAIVSSMRASALVGLKRDMEARNLIDGADKIARQQPDVLTTLFLGTVQAGRFDFAAEAFDKLIARAPDKVRELDPKLVGHFLRNEPEDQKDRNDDRAIALGKIGYGGPDEGDYFGMDAIRILLKRGDVSGAAEILPYVDDPSMVEGMLMMKSFSALWPKVEQAAGLNLEKVRASSVRSARLTYEHSPDDTEALSNFIYALASAGHLDEAIAFRSKLPASREAMADVDEQTGWAINGVASALDDAGRVDEADELLAMLNDAPVKGDNWRVNMMINRLDMLVDNGLFARADPLIDATEEFARINGNDFARQLVRTLKFCILSRMGRREEAASFLPFVQQHAADAAGATVDALLCAGHIDAAEELVLKSLEQDSFHTRFAHSLQSHVLEASKQTILRDGWKLLRSRPAVFAQFEKLARDLPKELTNPAP